MKYFPAPLKASPHLSMCNLHSLSVYNLQFALPSRGPSGCNSALN